MRSTDYVLQQRGSYPLFNISDISLMKMRTAGDVMDISDIDEEYLENHITVIMVKMVKVTIMME